MGLAFPPGAVALPLAEDLVFGCLDDEPTDRLFRRACERTLATLPPHERSGALAGVTGHVAESVAELLVDDLGYHMLWHFTGPGRHGIDLLVLCPQAEKVVAIEVKGTLRRGHWPRLTRREVEQFSVAWLDGPDNPGMANWDLRSEDVYGAVFLLNFADMAYRAAFTVDFARLLPVVDPGQVADLGWLDRESI